MVLNKTGGFKLDSSRQQYPGSAQRKKPELKRNYSRFKSSKPERLAGNK